MFVSVLDGFVMCFSSVLRVSVFKCFILFMDWNVRTPNIIGVDIFVGCKLLINCIVSSWLN